MLGGGSAGGCAKGGVALSSGTDLGSVHGSCAVSEPVRGGAALCNVGVRNGDASGAVGAVDEPVRCGAAPCDVGVRNGGNGGAGDVVGEPVRGGAVLCSAGVHNGDDGGAGSGVGEPAHGGAALCSVGVREGGASGTGGAVGEHGDAVCVGSADSRGSGVKAAHGCDASCRRQVVRVACTRWQARHVRRAHCMRNAAVSVAVCVKRKIIRSATRRNFVMCLQHARSRPCIKIERAEDGSGVVHEIP